MYKKTTAALAAILLAVTPTPTLSQERADSTLNSFDSQQIQCMAENLYHEARGEPLEGQIAVSNVVMNRAQSGRFPSTPCAVVRQRSNKGCQFSWVCSGSKTIREQAIYRRLIDISSQVYFHQVADNTNNAMFFHARSYRPKWKFNYKLAIGAHVFY